MPRAAHAPCPGIRGSFRVLCRWLYISGSDSRHGPPDYTRYKQRESSHRAKPDSAKLQQQQQKVQCCHCQPTQEDIKSKQLLIEAHMQLKADEKARLLEKAKKREEILALINKQREERVRKELLALPYKPKRMTQSPPKPACPETSNEAEETYQILRQFD
ncbi:hypothetical protein chiPu_0016280 [Chiloscyllium punctatum]|uniref:Cilia- and flagella-associated protein HOATZ n=1 Tax=Chiloscyllium punctatum TaxID=137246 RepID=A0A401T519_CHIPU|nr:hypothetical protein [Chiloscyllium punctatum]